MKSLARVRVDLNADTQILLSKTEPKVIEPAVVEHKSADMRLVFGMDDPRDRLRRIPRAYPKDLTFASTATAAPEVRECLIEYVAWQPIND